ncbi:glycosyltransferase [Desulfofustis limnaeus]|nr:glycosyltransferase [Desulfofustis limnaeus]
MQFLKMPRHDVLFIGYLGHLDVIVIWVFAKLKGTPVVWDAFLSLYDTIVWDRRLVHRYHPLAMVLYLWERLACRAADIVLLDTREHALHFVDQFSLDESRVGVGFVGAEPELFPKANPTERKIQNHGDLTVLFYGQFIPLHGIDIIVEAAALLRSEPVSWMFIGQGQEEEKIRNLIARHRLEKIEWVPWVAYDELHRWIQRVDVCLGIFGTSGKAGRVIPNKVFQILSCGKPLITRDSKAMRELIPKHIQGIHLIEPGSSESLAAVIKSMVQSGDVKVDAKSLDEVQQMITPEAVGRQVMEYLHRVSGVD